jgi:hypothetical protein
VAHCQDCPCDHNYGCQIQGEKGKDRCNDAAGGTFVRQVVDNSEEGKGKVVWAELDCPLSINFGEAKCDKGQLTYTSGYWHDGLDLEGGGVEVWNGTQVRTVYYFRHQQQLCGAADERDADGNKFPCTAQFYPCKGLGRTCTVEEGSGAVMCAEGNYGVKCALCKEGYVSSFTGPCVACDTEVSGGVDNQWILLILGCTFVVICVVMVLVAVKRSKRARHIIRILDERISAKAKLVASFFQIIILLGGVYQINWPIEYLDFLSIFSFFELDFLRIFQVGCLVSYTAHDTMYVVGIGLLIMLAVVIGGMIYLQQQQRQGKDDDSIRHIVGWVLLGTYCLYPFGCKQIFRVFQCKDIDNKRYLSHDMHIDCDSPAHKGAEAFSALVIMCFPIGLPLLYYLMLSINKFQLHHPRMSHLAFFYREYQDEFYYWESIECLRKCLLMGFAGFFKPGTCMQLIVVIFFTM